MLGKCSTTGLHPQTSVSLCRSEFLIYVIFLLSKELSLAFFDYCLYCGCYVLCFFALFKVMEQQNTKCVATPKRATRWCPFPLSQISVVLAVPGVHYGYLQLGDLSSF
jgi:hypothetical protein